MEIIDVGLQFGSMNMNNYPSIGILHHLEAEGANWTVEQIHNMHICERGWAGIGYHYYIRLDGSVYKGRPDGAVGAHCQGCNSNTIGVAFEGNYDTRTEMPQEQFNAWCELKVYLCNLYGNIPFFGHRENPRTPGSSECPGANFPLEKVKNATEADNTVYGWNPSSKGWWYCTDVQNKYYYNNQWAKIDGKWYVFDEGGYARHDQWIQADGKWYWLKANCAPARSQWLWIDSACYCFDQNGVLYVDCQTPDGYYVDDTGAWIK